MTRPLFIKIKLSNDLKISDEGWWIVKRTLAPAFATFFSTWHNCTAEKLSNPLVGSSKNTNAGFCPYERMEKDFY
jgi:hypothetical protein